MTCPDFSYGRTLLNRRQIVETTLVKPHDGAFTGIDGFIVGKVDGTWVAYDNICDHNGGTLCVDTGSKTATCPQHKWTLLLDESKYENNCPKQRLTVVENEKCLTVSRVDENFPEVDTRGLADAPVEFRFNAHASVSFDIDGLSVITDPWLIGSCFASGWWHAYPPGEEAVARLAASDLIYISHNHPDHLHLATLRKYVRKDMLFLIPDFESKSVEKILRREGYTNLIVADFLQEVLVATDHGFVKFLIVKAGDDRDDSSLLVYSKDDSILFGVDTNMPNKWILPDVNLLFTPFAGGASGFPSRIENFDSTKKREIIGANRHLVLNDHVRKLVQATAPRYVVPYAGYFTESYRDADVKEINVKNSAADLIDYLERNFAGTTGINPLDHGEFALYRGAMTYGQHDETPLYFVDEEYVQAEMEDFASKSSNADRHYLTRLGERFLASDFDDDLTVVVSPTHDDFSPCGEELLIIDFSMDNRAFRIERLAGLDSASVCDAISAHTRNNIELLRVRSNSLTAVLNEGLPLEELSIGFQARMYRRPNVYNFRFWDHFTNTDIIRLGLPR